MLKIFVKILLDSVVISLMNTHCRYFAYIPLLIIEKIYVYISSKKNFKFLFKSQ